MVGSWSPKISFSIINCHCVACMVSEPMLPPTFILPALVSGNLAFVSIFGLPIAPSASSVVSITSFTSAFACLHFNRACVRPRPMCLDPLLFDTLTASPPSAASTSFPCHSCRFPLYSTRVHALRLTFTMPKIQGPISPVDRQSNSVSLSRYHNQRSPQHEMARCST